MLYCVIVILISTALFCYTVFNHMFTFMTASGQFDLIGIVSEGVQTELQDTLTE